MSVYINYITTASLLLYITHVLQVGYTRDVEIFMVKYHRFKKTTNEHSISLIIN